MPSSIPASAIEAPAADAPRPGLALFARRNPTIVIGGLVMLALIAVALLAPWIAGDPLKLSPINRLRPPSERFWFGSYPSLPRRSRCCNSRTVRSGDTMT